MYVGSVVVGRKKIGHKVTVSVADKGDIAGDREKPKWQYLPSAERREHGTRRQSAEEVVEPRHCHTPIRERKRLF
jgi:ribosomal protein L13